MKIYNEPPKIGYTFEVTDDIIISVNTNSDKPEFFIRKLSEVLFVPVSFNKYKNLSCIPQDIHSFLKLSNEDIKDISDWLAMKPCEEYKDIDNNYLLLTKLWCNGKKERANKLKDIFKED